MTEHVELWLRSASSWTVGRGRTVVDDLETLAVDGIVESYDVAMWDDQVPVAPDTDLTDRQQRIRERVETVRSWADEHGYDLPAFSRTRQVGAVPWDDGPTAEARVLPLAALLGFEDGTLAWVAPYADGDEHVAVQDRLEALARAAGPDAERARAVVEAE